MIITSHTHKNFQIHPCLLKLSCKQESVQLLVHGRWFSPGTPASSTTKTGCHDIAESGVKMPKFISNPTDVL
jgi:hypothetical protein